MMRIGLVGLGNLGSAIGNLIAWNGYDVLGWEYSKSVAEEINAQHTMASMRLRNLFSVLSKILSNKVGVG